MGSIRSKLTYANVMASIAVFAALGGGAFAASQVAKAPKDSVVSKSIKNGKVKTGDLQDGGVTGADLLDGDVRGADIANGAVGGADLTDGDVGGVDLTDNDVSGNDLADGTVGSADLADNGVTGTDVDEGSLGKVGDANTIDAVDSTGFFQYETTIPSGTTIRGVWGGREYGATNLLIQDYGFPLAGPTALTDADVNFAANGTSGTIGSDDDATCTGSVGTPTAPAGKVCIYASADGILASDDSAQGRASVSPRRGFEVRGPSNAAGDVEVHGSWAYTAP